MKHDFKFKEGQILLTHTHYMEGQGWFRYGVIPKGIRIFLGNYWNHAAIIVKLSNKLYILEADETGFNTKKTLKQWLKESSDGYRDFAVIDTKSYNPDKLQDVINARYDYKALFIDQTLYRIGLKLNKWFGANFDWYFGHTGSFAKKRVYCFEGVAYLCELPEYYKITSNEILEKYPILYEYRYEL